MNHHFFIMQSLCQLITGYYMNSDIPLCPIQRTIVNMKGQTRLSLSPNCAKLAYSRIRLTKREGVFHPRKKAFSPDTRNHRARDS